MKKFNELNKEIQEHIKGKQIIEQELNKEKQELNEKNELNEREQELNEKEQKLNEKGMELTINKIKINDIEYQNELLKRRLDDFLRPIDLKKKESDTIKKLSKESEEAKIKRLNIIHDTNIPNTIDDIIKSYDDLSAPTKIPQSVRKRDDKARILVPKKFENDIFTKI